MKAWRALETGKKTGAEILEPRRLTQMLVTPRPERLGYIRFAFERGMSVREVARLTGMDPWFLHQIREITLAQMAIAQTTPEDISAEAPAPAQAPRPQRRAHRHRVEARRPRRHQQVRELREGQGIRPVFKLVDTCAAEFESMTPYLYSTYEEEDEAPPTTNAEDHHSRLRSQSHRPGHRVRLLLLPRRLRAQRRWLRDHHGQLQS